MAIKITSQDTHADGTLVVPNKLGIGTSSPSATLTTNGTLHVTSTSAVYPTAGKGLEILYNSAGDLGQIQSYDRSTVAWKPLSLFASAFDIYTNAAQRFIINSSGNVGIGTSNPIYAILDVAGNINIRGDGYLNIGSSGYGDVSIRPTGSGGGRGMSFWTYNGGASQKVTIDLNGNVGIGTSSPGAKLEVSGNIRFTSETGSALQFGTIGAPWTYITTETNTSSGTDMAFYNSQGSNPNASFVFRASDTSVRFMTIRNDGKVGIGTTSPAYTLDVNGSMGLANNGGVYIKNNAGTFGGAAVVDTVNQFILGSTSFSSTYIQCSQHIYFSSGSANRAILDSSGRLGIGTLSPGYQLTLSTDSAAKPTSNTWTISSDARVKTVLGDFTRGLMDIVGLMPKRYHLNGAYGTVDDGREHVSVIAQDVQTTWPAMVGEYTHVEKDEEAGTETETTLLSLNTNELQWALVNAIKELTARVVTLEQAAA